MACRLVGAKPLSEPMLGYFNWTLTNKFSKIVMEIHTFLFKQMRLKLSSGKWWPFCLGLNVLILHKTYCLIPDASTDISSLLDMRVIFIWHWYLLHVKVIWLLNPISWYSYFSKAISNVEVKAKGPEHFCWCIQTHFVIRKLFYFASNFTGICSQSQQSTFQLASIGSDNGLAPNRPQTNIWNNDQCISTSFAYLCIFMSVHLTIYG